MSRRTISETELAVLFDFMRRKRVRYYDLQVELVDHFASAIEDLWAQNPDLSLEKAIHQVYSQFPVTGFSSLIDTRAQAIQREAWRWVFGAWLDYFRWPKLLLSICIILVLRLVFYLPVDIPILFTGFFALVLIGGSWMIYQSQRGAGTGEPRFLKLQATYGVITNFINAINLLFYLVIFSQLEAFPDWAAWVAAVFFTYAGFLLYILLFQLPKRTKEELHRHFPQYI